jgi:CheY-like chemotaxis protein
MGAKQRVLIIDDNHSLVLVAQRLLQKEGFDVFTAYDGLEGLEKAKIEQPDIIVLDIVMPGMNGYDVCRQLKNNPDTAYIPVLILSVKGDTDTNKGKPAIGLKEVHTGYECGAYNFLTKPVTADQLLNAIKAELTFSAFLDTKNSLHQHN